MYAQSPCQEGTTLANRSDDEELVAMVDGRDYPWKALGARIRAARLGAALTQKQLAYLVGVAPNTVWAWEAGRMKPVHDNLVEIAFHCATGVRELEGRDVVISELRKEAEVSFRDAVDDLPDEDVESIQEFIRFVRRQRHERKRGER